MQIVKFEDIIDWQKAQDLAVEIYEALCSEVKLMLYLAERLDNLEKDNALQLRQNCLEISKIISGFINR